jgi:hypothetical protein
VKDDETDLACCVENACRALVGRAEGKRSHRRTRRRRKHINIGLREIGMEGVNEIQLAQDRKKWRALVSVVINHRHPQNTLEFLDQPRNCQFLKNDAAIRELFSCLVS